MKNPVLRPADILLPPQEADFGKWAVLACDQFTSQVEYWQQAEQIVSREPSTLRMILPEVYLEEHDTPARIQAIHEAMRQYISAVLTRSVHGYVYVERTQADGSVRQGLIGCVDLEDYSYEAGSTPRIRPSERTVEERIPPRLAVRRGAPLESPHILMLADDPEKAIVEPFAEKKKELRQLYDTELMLGGGRVQAWAVTEEKDLEEIAKKLEVLDRKERFCNMYEAAQEAVPFALAVGDGNHSLATAKAYWEEIKKTLPEGKRKNHPARLCLVELENIQSEAIVIEPIHRVLFGADWQQLLQEIVIYLEENNIKMLPGPQGEQQFTVISAKESFAFGIQNAPAPLAVGTLEEILQKAQRKYPQWQVDYVHGADAVHDLAQKGAIGVLLPGFEKSDLFKGVALGGVLPKKTFSMGHAVEKRYYIECRKIEE